jgi:hypothetical protein
MWYLQRTKRSCHAPPHTRCMRSKYQCSMPRSCMLGARGRLRRHARVRSIDADTAHPLAQCDFRVVCPPKLLPLPPAQSPRRVRVVYPRLRRHGACCRARAAGGAASPALRAGAPLPPRVRAAGAARAAGWRRRAAGLPHAGAARLAAARRGGGRRRGAAARASRSAARRRRCHAICCHQGLLAAQRRPPRRRRHGQNVRTTCAQLLRGLLRAVCGAPRARADVSLP